MKKQARLAEPFDKSFSGVSCQGQREVPFVVRKWDAVRIVVGF